MESTLVQERRAAAQRIIDVYTPTGIEFPALPEKDMDFQEVEAWNTYLRGLIQVAEHKYKSKAQPEVARKLAGIMQRQRRGAVNLEYGQRAGKVNRSALSRVPAGYERPFIREGEPSPTKVRMVVLLDMSGSMHYGAKMEDSLQMCRNLIDATKNIKSVNTEVWGHTTQDLMPGDALEPETQTLAQGDYLLVQELWRPGVSMEQFHKALNGTFFWGNEDGYAIESVHQESSKGMDPSERLFFVVISDGSPVYTEKTKAVQHVKKTVTDLRRKGVGIISVSVSEDLTPENQREMYGDDFVVPFDNNATVLAQSIARAVGKALD